ncbi:MAG: sugar transferase [Eubacterium sp.]|nr:sugar transferase [Eubacterium sp.]
MIFGLFAIFDTIAMLFLRSLWKAVIRNRFKKDEHKAKVVLVTYMGDVKTLRNVVGTSRWYSRITAIILLDEPDSVTAMGETGELIAPSQRGQTGKLIGPDGRAAKGSAGGASVASAAGGAVAAGGTSTGAVGSAGAGGIVTGGIVMGKNGQPETIDGIPVIYRSDILEYCKKNVVDEVYILAARKDTDKLSNMFISMGITVHLTLDVFIRNMPNAHVDNVNGYTVLTAGINNATIGQQLVKRAFDIVVGAIGLIFTGLITIFIAPIIKKQSPGPVFFAQERVGRNGRKFKMYKFRSMYVDAEERKKELMAQNEMKGLMFKMENDPRITPIGRFIRKTSLDEFPQFLNILKGDMSLVGTRPPTLDEFEKYHAHHMSRLAMRPGLTGMWQTSGRSDITDFEEIVQLDNEYIRNFSLGLDVKIILKTFGAVLGMKGSK